MVTKGLLIMNLKQGCFLVCIFLIFVAMLLCVLNAEGTANFSDKFTNTFNLSELNCDDVRERAKTNALYSVDEVYDSSGQLSSWTLRLSSSDEFILILDFFVSTTKADQEQSYRIRWWRSQGSAELESAYSQKASKAKYRCEAVLDASWAEHTYISTYGNNVADCVNRIEQVLLNMYYDLIPIENQLGSE